MANKSKAGTYVNEQSISVDTSVMFASAVGLKAEHTWDEPDETGMIGTTRPLNSGRQVTKTDVKGPVTIRPSYAHANTLLKAVFDETTGTFTPADDPTATATAAVVIDRGVNVHTYASCWVNVLTLSAGENAPVDWTLDLLGTTEVDSGSVAALTPPDRMLMSDLTFSLNSNVYFPTSFSWMYTYRFDERFHQSVTRSSVLAHIPYCQLTMTVDVNADNYGDLMDLSGTDTTMDDVIVTATDGGNTMVITMPETTNMSPSQFPDSGGVDASTFDVVLRAWSATAEADFVTITYA